MLSPDVIGDEVLRLAQKFLRKVKVSGSNNIMATCPFHLRADGTPERHPSFAISLTTGLYFCHSCQSKGNLRQLLYALQVPAVTIRNQYGILLDAVAKNSPKPRNPTQARCAVITLDAGESAYLPNGLLGLFDFIPMGLVNEGFLPETLEYFEVGYDEYNQRITFPLRDMAGNLLGISGRAIDDNARRRFKVYDLEYAHWRHPNRLTNMSDMIWNLHNVYAQTYQRVHAPVVIVEGFKGCMWVHQAGVRNVVALCGAYLKEGQQWLLEHLSPEAYIMLDNDKAGQEGTQYAAETLARTMPVHVVTYRSSAKQPTDLKPEEVLEALDNATPYSQWKMKQQFRCC